MVCMRAAPRPKRQHYAGSNTPRGLCLANIQFTLSKASRILLQRTILSLSWNPPLVTVYHIPLPAPITAGCGRNEVGCLGGVPSCYFAEQWDHDRLVLVASWTSTTLQLAAVREPIHLSSTPYRMHRSFRVTWPLVKRLKRRFGALESECCSMLHGIMHGRNALDDGSATRKRAC